MLFKYYTLESRILLPKSLKKSNYSYRYEFVYLLINENYIPIYNSFSNFLHTFFKCEGCLWFDFCLPQRLWEVMFNFGNKTET